MQAETITNIRVSERLTTDLYVSKRNSYKTKDKYLLGGPRIELSNNERHLIFVSIKRL